VLFAPTAAGSLSKVSSNGGAVTEVTVLDAARGETGHRFPAFLPDGRHFLYASLPGRTGQIAIYLGALDSPDRRQILTAESTPVYADPGYLLYSRRGVLVAHRFDPAAREFTGEAVPLGDMPGEVNLTYTAGRAVSVTRTGALAYLSAAQQQSRLAWLDQSGREVGAIGIEPGPYVGVAVSPNGKSAVVVRLAAPEASLWLADLERGGLSPLTNSSGFNAWPVWSPDGTRVLFGSDREGPLDLYVRTLGAPSDEVVYRSADLFKFPASWSAKGDVVFWILSTDAKEDLWTVDAAGKPEPRLVVRSPRSDLAGRISPDGRWIAYISDQSGQLDAYLQPFPGPGAATRITTTGTSDYGVWWGPDSRQLLILGADLQVFLVDISTTPDLDASAPRAVGRIPFVATTGMIDATRDLKRLLAIVPEQASGYRSITVLRNWLDAVR
jgi:Tol biopolymer transport system component